MYELAADIVLIIHFLFILFVIFGALFFFVAKKMVFIHDYNIILELKAIQKKIQNQEITQLKKYFNIYKKK